MGKSEAAVFSWLPLVGEGVWEGSLVLFMETYSQTVQSEPPRPHSGDLAPQFLSSELPAPPSSPYAPKLWSQLSPVSCELSFWGFQRFVGVNHPLLPLVLFSPIFLNCQLNTVSGRSGN